MTSDSEDAGISRHRFVLLDGHDNYKEWLRYLRNLLTGKDLLDVADGTDTTTIGLDTSHGLEEAGQEGIQCH